jgi:hypothetical protein
MNFPRRDIVEMIAAGPFGALENSWDYRQPELVGSSRVNLKSSAWKNAIAFFLVIVAVRGGWNLIAKRGESALYILGWSALPAVLLYVFSREDWFD